ncbi:GAP family protein [Mycobacterium sp. TNTM28]|uniref:GAP family protein n=1 Tax=[Mycobacterium] fortunisiensis TaxID=2600579 RepID=A0ABS6KHV4_9MYCO|nr:GAP family protein [[Mycobacterium] fortunisiensis]MBU9763106.1 GAP family protein [[Mycobacterium] fortunisiensis]
MWGPILVLALLTTVNPVRLGIILMVLSRPRPIKNLLAWWLGALIVGLVSLFIPLILLHTMPASANFVKDFAHPTTSPAAQYIAIGLGVLLLAGSVLMAVRSSSRASARSGVVTQSNTGRQQSTGGQTAPSSLSLLLESEEPAQEGRSAVQRLLGRIRRGWRTGSPWISFVVGLVVLPPADAAVLILAVVVASGVAIDIQIAAVAVYVIVALAVEEIILLNSVVAPERTHAVLRRLHEWSAVHQRKLVAALMAVAGAFLLLRGVAS